MQDKPYSDEEIIRELRIKAGPQRMVDIINYIDRMNLGVLPDYMAIFLAAVSDAGNWHIQPAE